MIRKQEIFKKLVDILIILLTCHFAEKLAEHRAKKAEMIAEEAKLHFSYDMHQQETPDEKLANEKL